MAAAVLATVAFVAGAFFATVAFFTGAFFATALAAVVLAAVVLATVAFVAGAFFAAAVRAEALVAGAFFAPALAAEALVAAARVAEAFVAGAFFATVFFAAVLRTAPAAAPLRTAGPSDGIFCDPETIALNWAPGRKAGTEVGLTLTVSPVRGLRATRAARRRRSNTPKPVMVTLSPFCTARTIASIRCSTASPAWRRSVSSFSVRTSINSALFIQILRNSGPLWTDCRIR